MTDERRDDAGIWLQDPAGTRRIVPLEEEPCRLCRAEKGTAKRKGLQKR